MLTKLKRCWAWLVTPREVVRSDAVFDVPPIYYPMWLLTDLVFGVPPRLAQRLVRSRERQKEPRVGS